MLGIEVMVLGRWCRVCRECGKIKFVENVVKLFVIGELIWYDVVGLVWRC